jgi:hypothetical protein
MPFRESTDAAERVVIDADLQQRFEDAKKQVRLHDLGAQVIVGAAQRDDGFPELFRTLHPPPLFRLGGRSSQRPKAMAEIMRFPCRLRWAK